MIEFGGGKELSPFLGIVGTKDSKIGLNLLIGSFSLTICLEMLGSGEVDIIVE